MDLTITKKTENPLLSRQEVEAKITFEGSTPKRIEVQKALTKTIKAKNEKMVVIQTIQTIFGHTQATLVAHIYSDEKTMKDNERANLLEKHAGHKEEPIEEKKATETPAAEEPAKEEKTPEASK